ncbi:hypothetical protein VF21_09330 [Pseudogymnoascus sp. 05NY08]|nr:hypothetical protein VF21_09330 [Pseudogymnoascus sp. 05NY08]
MALARRFRSEVLAPTVSRVAKVAVALFVLVVLTLMSSFNLNTTNGVRNALAEIKGIKRALNNYRRALEARATIEGVSSKEDRDSNGSKAT